jgi:ABC-2 type transport system permease protein
MVSAMKKRYENRRNPRRSNITMLLLGITVIILVNIIAGFIFTRIDLTAEKRYSLSPATKSLLKKVNDVVFFKVYLEGDLPSGFRRLSNETKEMLNEFRAYSKYIQYEFVNPSENVNAKERNAGYQLLTEEGLQPTTLRVNKKGEATQMIIFPGAIVTYKGKEVPVKLLQDQIGQDPEKVLNTSIQALEYNLASAIQKLATRNKPSIAFIEGQGELTRPETIDMEAALAEFYTVDRVTIDSKISSLAFRMKSDTVDNRLINKYKLIIIAKPTKPFSEKDKFLIDQFIMRGGRVLWLIDPVFASMDSLKKYDNTIGIANDINLEDMLFNYGVRLNNNLVLDLTALPIPVKTGQVGNQPKFEFFPWFYFPIITPTRNHPVVNGLNAIMTQFVSSIDTVSAQGVRKTILLTTSPYSRTINVPAMIDLDVLRKEPDQRLYDQGPQAVAALLEGEFTSAYLFRIPPELADNPELGYRQKSKPTRMIVISDGDVIANQFHFKEGYPLPLGFDQYTQQTFGNKELLLNVVNYLTDDSGLISVRSRELKLRLLDSSRIANEKLIWQLLNTVLPVILILLFGLVKFRVRTRKYGRNGHSQ